MKKIVSIILSLIMIMTVILGVNSYRSLPAAPAHRTPAHTSSDKSDKGDKNSVKYNKVDIDYFNDALFIGDSRTVGLKKYTTLPYLTEADFFAQTGLSAAGVYSVTNEELGEDVTIIDKLESGSYGKVYIMLGVNEITNILEENLKMFTDLIETVRAYQPQALIFIQSNIHVGKEYSESAEERSNARLEEYNQMLSKLADNKSIYYLNINEVYDDADGNLSEEFTSDNLHLDGDCHEPWVEYLKNHAIVKVK